MGFTLYHVNILNLHNIAITRVKGFLILIEKLLSLKLENFIW